MSERITYENYLRSQREKFLDILKKTKDSKESEMKFDSKGVLSDFTGVLKFFLSPSISERRDQIVEWGVSPTLTTHIDFNGDQTLAAMRVVNVLSSFGNYDDIREIAAKLEQIVENL